MKTQLTFGIRRAFLTLSGVVLLMLAALTGISALLIWDSNTRLAPLHEQAEILAEAQNRLLDHLVIEQGRLDSMAGLQGDVTQAEVERRDALLDSMDAVVKQVAASLKALGAAQSEYASLNSLAAVGVGLLVLALVALALVARERILKPLAKLVQLLSRLAHEDYRPESLDGVDAFIRPPFESYNRLVGRLARLENAHQARHRRMETQVREAVRALIAQRVELARVERLAALGELAAALAHEVRNPLTAIRAACRSLIDDTGEEDTRARLRLIEEEVERLADLVNQQLSRTPRRPEEPRPSDIKRLIRNLVRLMKYQMPKSITLRVDLPRHLTARLPPDGLRQALLNLIRNSQEALEGKDGVISILADEGDEEIEIRVEDTGPGFADAMLAGGVRRFVTGKAGGTGLGLAMVDRYVRDQGGRLELENRPEGGARVRIVLPRGSDVEVRAA
jgi:two-component system, NtrC family, sensor kinase